MNNEKEGWGTYRWNDGHCNIEERKIKKKNNLNHWFDNNTLNKDTEKQIGYIYAMTDGSSYRGSWKAGTMNG